MTKIKIIAKNKLDTCIIARYGIQLYRSEGESRYGEISCVPVTTLVGT